MIIDNPTRLLSHIALGTFETIFLSLGHNSLWQCPGLSASTCSSTTAPTAACCGQRDPKTAARPAAAHVRDYLRAALPSAVSPALLAARPLRWSLPCRLLSCRRSSLLNKNRSKPRNSSWSLSPWRQRLQDRLVPPVNVFLGEVKVTPEHLRGKL